MIHDVGKVLEGKCVVVVMGMNIKRLSVHSIRVTVFVLLMGPDISIIIGSEIHMSTFSFCFQIYPKLVSVST